MPFNKSLIIRQALVGFFLLLVIFSLYYGLRATLFQKELSNEIFYSTEKVIVLEKGNYRISQDLVVPHGTTLFLNSGITIEVDDNVSIIVFGKIQAFGTPNNPIFFKNTYGYWDGIYLYGEGYDKLPNNIGWEQLTEITNIFDDAFFHNTKTGNILNYVHIEDVRPSESYGLFEENINPINCMGNCSGSYLSNTLNYRNDSIERNKQSALNVHNASLLIANSKFTNLVFVGAIQGQNSNIVMINNTIDAEGIHLTLFDSKSIIFGNSLSKNSSGISLNDGIAAFYSISLIADNSIQDLGDDAIDITGGYAYVINNDLIGNFDDGIDVGEQVDSKFYIIGNKIKRNLQNGALITNSEAILINNVIQDNDLSGLLMRNNAKIVSLSDTIVSNYVNLELSFTPTKPIGTYKDLSMMDEQQLIGLSKEFPNKLLAIDLKVAHSRTSQDMIDPDSIVYYAALLNKTLLNFEGGDDFYLQLQSLKNNDELINKINIVTAKANLIISGLEFIKN